MTKMPTLKSKWTSGSKQSQPSTCQKLLHNVSAVSEITLRLPRGVKERIPTPLHKELASSAPAPSSNTQIKNILNLILNVIIHLDRRRRGCRLPNRTSNMLLEHRHVKYIMYLVLRRQLNPESYRTNCSQDPKGSDKPRRQLARNPQR